MVYLVRRSDFLNYLSFSDAFHTKIRTVRKHGLLPGHTWSFRKRWSAALRKNPQGWIAQYFQFTK